MSDTTKSGPELKFSLVIGTGMLIQAATALLWAGAAGERLDELERRAEVTAVVTERTARLEEQVYHVRASLDRIERRLQGDEQE